MAKELSPPKGLAMAKENLLMLKKLALVKVMSKQADDYCVTIILINWLFHDLAGPTAFLVRVT